VQELGLDLPLFGDQGTAAIGAWRAFARVSEGAMFRWYGRSHETSHHLRNRRPPRGFGGAEPRWRAPETKLRGFPGKMREIRKIVSTGNRLVAGDSPPWSRAWFVLPASLLKARLIDG
jgi:hypothetical protein